MKLCKIAFENINSLAGHWSIDFEAQPFEDGLFLITGDTGSGKTSILDAISLALYGRTAREDVTRNRNEVMTRGRGTAWAEAEFECEEGGEKKRYRARWEQARARGKASATLQGVKIFLFDVAADRDISEHRAGDTQKMIAEKIGLSFDQFQRTMMLAQGKFDRFLSADESDRSEILEQATGTEIYSQVGARIHEHWQSAGQDVKSLTEQLGKIETMPETERTQKQNDLNLGTRQQEEKAETLNAATHKLTDYRQKETVLNTARADLSTRNQAVADCSAAVTQVNQRVTACETAKTAARTALSEKEPLIAQAIAFKQKLQLEEQALKTAQDLLRTARETYGARVTAHGGLQKRIVSNTALIQMVTDALGGTFAAPTDADATRDPLVTQAQEYVSWAASFAGKQQQINELHNKFNAASEAYNAVEATYRAVRPGLLAARDNAEKALALAKIVDKLETHRAHLEDGKPCPLCGSLEHPYARGNKPVKSTCQEAYEQAKKALDDLDEGRNAALEERLQAEQAWHNAENAVEQEKIRCEDRRQNLDRAKESLSAQVRSDRNQLKDLDREILDAQAAVESQEKSWRAKSHECEGIRNQIEALQLGQEPEDLRMQLQNALEQATTNLSDARRDQGIAVANATTAQTEAQKAQDTVTKVEAAFNAVQATIPDPVQYEKSIKKLDKEKKELDESLVKIQIELALDNEQLRKKAECLATLESAKNNLAKWKKLNDWLGGAGGEQFKRYAQGITLRQLLSAAKPHLSAMTQGRYELIWDPEDADASKLLPSVVDKDQGGEKRPVTNLSGGERFQVSLALALGLSKMSGNRLSVDSLFLDEGFGTLDGKMLESALDTLCRIQQEGKLIGIISHVTEVGERIPTQIEVRKIGGGLSVLEGAGVTSHA